MYTYLNYLLHIYVYLYYYIYYIVQLYLFYFIYTYYYILMHIYYELGENPRVRGDDRSTSGVRVDLWHPWTCP